MNDIEKVGIFAIRDGRVLLCHKRGIDTPISLGGKLEPGETHEACARREAREEAQCEIANIRFLNTFRGPHIDRDCTITLHAYLADLLGEPRARPADSIYAFSWVGPHERNAYILPHTLDQIFTYLATQGYLR